MKGTILDFSVQTNTGIITGDDDNRYNFEGAEWRGQSAPVRGQQVDFDINPEGHAVQVYNAVGAHNLNSTVQNLSDQLDKISDQNKAEEQFNMIDWFVKGLKNYTNFTGRARRKEYWFFILSQFIILVVLQILDNLIGTNYIFYAIGVLALFLPSIAVTVRRLHDTGRSGWWYWIALIPIVGAILLLVWLATETKQEANQWGNPAK